MAACEFDQLLTKSVPHIIEKIFFSLDYKSFKNCLEVCTAWKELLTSQSFQRTGKSVFGEDFDKDFRKAIEKGDEEEVRKILASGMADINNLGEENITPLYMAASWGFSIAVQLLIEGGADPNRGELQHAVLSGHLNVVKVLLDGWADPNRVVDWSCPLHVAAKTVKGADLAKVLIDGGANPNLQTSDGSTPLHWAARNENKDMVQVLLDRGADRSMADRSGRTPLYYALDRGCSEIVNILRIGPVVYRCGRRTTHRKWEMG